MKTGGYALKPWHFLILLLALFAEAADAAKVLRVARSKKRMMVKLSKFEAAKLSRGDRVELMSNITQDSFEGRIVRLNKRRARIKLADRIVDASKGDRYKIKSLETTSGRSGYFVRANPITLTAGSISGEMGLAVSDISTVGLAGAYTKFEDTLVTYTGYNLGIRTGFYFSGAEDDSWYLKVGGGYANFSMTLFLPAFSEPSEDEIEYIDEDSGIQFKTQFFYGESLLGYQWFWDSGIHINFGYGVVYNSYSESSFSYIDEDGEEQQKDNLFLPKVAPRAELTLGYML